MVGHPRIDLCGGSRLECGYGELGRYRVSALGFGFSLLWWERSIRQASSSANERGRSPLDFQRSFAGVALQRVCSPHRGMGGLASTSTFPCRRALCSIVGQNNLGLGGQKSPPEDSSHRLLGGRDVHSICGVDGCCFLAVLVSPGKISREFFGQSSSEVQGDDTQDATGYDLESHSYHQLGAQRLRPTFEDIIAGP